MFNINIMYYLTTRFLEIHIDMKQNMEYIKS